MASMRYAQPVIGSRSDGAAATNRLNVQRGSNSSSSSNSTVLKGVPPQAMTSSNSNKASLPTLCQIMAMTMTYRRLAFSWLFIPSLFLGTPIIFKSFFLGLDWLAGGLGLLSLMVALLLTAIWLWIVYLVAPSTKKLQKAYEDSIVLLPILSLVVSSSIFMLIARADIAAMVPQFLRWTPTGFSWVVGARSALGFAFIGAAVLFRFVGGLSFVRCSTAPLLSNNYFPVIRSLLSYEVRGAYSLPQIPMMRTGGYVRTVIALFRRRNRIRCRRYQCPTIRACMANLFVTCVLGYAAAECMLVPYCGREYQSSWEEYEVTREFIVANAILVMVFHLCVPEFDGMSHEINPKRYHQRSFGAKVFATTTLTHTVKRVAISTVVGVSVSAAYCYYGRGFDDLGVHLMMYGLAVSILVGLYAAFFEESVKAVLFAAGTRRSLEQFVQEVMFGGDYNTYTLSSIAMAEAEISLVDVMLHSLSHSDNCLVKQIGEPIECSGFSKPEVYEAERNHKAIARMAHVLFGLTRPEASLEEDLLRLSILESIGGSSVTPMEVAEKTSSHTMLKNYPMDQHHYRAISYWVRNNQDTSYYDTATADSKGILLTRALSAYAGGLGQALLECSKLDLTANTWVIRPGALVATEYTVIALSRCFEHGFQDTEKTATDWRRSHLLTLIPATLNSLFRLHLGLMEYAFYHHKLQQLTLRGTITANVPPSFDVKMMIMKEHADLLSLILAIDYAAKAVLGQLKNASADPYHTKCALDRGCVEWIDGM